MKIKQVIALKSYNSLERFNSDKESFDNLVNHLDKNKTYKLNHIENDKYELYILGKREPLLKNTSITLENGEAINNNLTFWLLSDIDVSFKTVGYIVIELSFIYSKGRKEQIPLVEKDKSVEDLSSLNYDEIKDKIEGFYKSTIDKAKFSWFTDESMEEFPILPSDYDEIGRKASIFIVNLMLKNLNKIILVDTITMRDALVAVRPYNKTEIHNGELEDDLNVEYKRPTYTIEDALQLLGLYIKIRDEDIEKAKDYISEKSMNLETIYSYVHTI